MPDAPFSTGILFIKTRDHNGNDLVAYYQHNHLQAPLQAIDKQGNIRWAAQYTAFGQTSIISSGDSAINSNLRLPGQYADSESGLYYNWQRYYDANTGRYISSDPIGLTGGFNRYAYVGGNPVGWVDPSGEFKFPKPPILPKGRNGYESCEVKKINCRRMCGRPGTTGFCLMDCEDLYGATSDCKDEPEPDHGSENECSNKDPEPDPLTPDCTFAKFKAGLCN